MENKEDRFIQGYICAVANLLRERDTPVHADGLLKLMGLITLKRLKDAGVDQQDINVLRKYKLIVPPTKQT